MQGVHLGTYPFRTNIVNPHYLTVGAPEPAHQSQRGILRISEGLSTSTEQILQQNPPFQKPPILLIFIPYAQYASSKLIVPRHAQLPDMSPRSDTQALRFIASIPLIQRREKCPSREEKVPSRSGFSASMYVVLKTRHVNPNIHVRRY